MSILFSSFICTGVEAPRSSRGAAWKMGENIKQEPEGLRGGLGDGALAAVTALMFSRNVQQRFGACARPPV